MSSFHLLAVFELLWPCHESGLDAAVSQRDSIPLGLSLCQNFSYQVCSVHYGKVNQAEST